MKKFISLFTLVFAMFLASQVNAQINIPKNVDKIDAGQMELPDNDFTSSILKALDPGKSFTSPDKYAKLLSGNKDLVGDVMNVVNGSGSEDEKMAKVDALKGDHKDFVEQLLGEGKATDYYRLIKNNIEPLTKKFKLAKLFL